MQNRLLEVRLVSRTNNVEDHSYIREHQVSGFKYSAGSGMRTAMFAELSAPTQGFDSGDLMTPALPQHFSLT